MFATPGRQQQVDKENLDSQVKTPGKSLLNPLLTPARKPLARLNQETTSSQRRRPSQGKALSKIWTDPTPAEEGSSTAATPARKTPGRKTKRKSRGPSSSSFSSVSGTPQTVTQAADAILREVLLQEITDLSSSCAQQERQSESEDSHQIVSGDGDRLVEEAVTRLVDDSLRAALQELRDEQESELDPQGPTAVIRSESLSSVDGTPTTEGLWSIALGLEDDFSLSGSALLGQQGDVSVSDEFGGVPFGDSTEILTVGDGGRASSPESVEEAGSPSAMPVGQILVTSPATIQATDITEMLSAMSLTEPEASVQVVPDHSADTIEKTYVSLGTAPFQEIDISETVATTETVDSSTETVPVALTDVAIGTTPIKTAEVTDSAVSMTPFMFRDASMETTPTTPILKTDGCVMTSPIGVADSASMTTQIHLADANHGTTPIRQTDNSTATTPARLTDAHVGTTPLRSVDVVDRSVAMTPVQMMDSAFGTSPLHLTSTSTATTPTHLTDASIGTTPLKPVEMRQNFSVMTPIRMTDAAFGTSPVKSADANFGTDPIESVDSGQCTDPVQVTHSCTGTSPVKVAETAVGTGPLETADAQCGMTPVRVIDVRCGTTPHRVTDAGTAVTPLAVNTVETLTSPIVVPAFRLEAESPSQLDPASLRSHMESACISNELLRRENDTLKASQAQLLVRLEQREEAQREQQLEPKTRARQVTEETLQGHVDDLLVQVGEQMNQLSLLQGAVDQKSAELAASQRDKTMLRDQYQKEMHNLQQDLRTAYKQHQQEVSDLKAFYQENDYEPHYHRAMATVRELRAEVQAFTDLKDTLDEAAKIQEQFGCMEEAYSLVNTLFTKTMDKKKQLEAEHFEMVDKMSSINSVNELLQEQLEAANEQQQHLKTALDSALVEKESALQCQSQLTRDLEKAVQVLEEAKMELHSTTLELFGVRDDYESEQSRNEELQRQSVEHFLTESSLEAALAVQGRQWQESAAKMEALRSEAVSEMTSLKQRNTRLEAEASDLKDCLSQSQGSVSEMKSELEKTKEMLQQQVAELDALRTELKSNREARAVAQKLTKQIQSLRQQFKDDTDFLEEERQALVEAAREAEDQLKVTTLELSRLKVARRQAEEMSSQWKSAAETLSEKLQFCQSELDNTKAQAHWMLLNQASEMRDASNGLTALFKKIQDICVHLNIGTTDQSANKSKSETDQQAPPGGVEEGGIKTQSSRHAKRTTAPPSGSLVSSILSAVNTKDGEAGGQPELHSQQPEEATSTSPESQSGLHTPENPSETSDERRLTIGGSGASAFTTVQTSANQEARTTECKEENSQADAEVRSDEELPLMDQVEQARVLLGKLLQALLAKNESLESTVQELKEETSRLNSQLVRAQKQHDREQCLLREQLRESEMRERRLQQEVSNCNASQAEQEQALQYAQQRLQAMADNLERFSDQKTAIENLQTEKAKLTSSLRIVQREKDHLQEQLDNVLSSGSSQSSGTVAPQQTAASGKLIKENLSLKKELDKLRVRLVERQEHYESLNARATRHVRVLEDNWHKADAEVYRLDELFDHCKQLIEKVPVSGDESSNMAALRELLS